MLEGSGSFNGWVMGKMQRVAFDSVGGERVFGKWRWGLGKQRWDLEIQLCVFGIQRCVLEIQRRDFAKIGWRWLLRRAGCC